MLRSKRDVNHIFISMTLSIALLQSATGIDLYDCDVILNFGDGRLHLLSNIKEVSNKLVYLNKSDSLTIFCSHKCNWIVSILAVETKKKQIDREVLGYQNLFQVTGDSPFKLQIQCEKFKILRIVDTLAKLRFRLFNAAKFRAHIIGPSTTLNDHLLACHRIVCEYDSITELGNLTHLQVTLENKRVEVPMKMRNNLSIRYLLEATRLQSRRHDEQRNFNVKCVKVTLFKFMDTSLERTFTSRMKRFKTAGLPVSISFNHESDDYEEDTDESIIFHYSHTYTCMFDSLVSGKVQMEVSGFNVSLTKMINKESGSWSTLAWKPEFERKGIGPEGFIRINCSMTIPDLCKDANHSKTFSIINYKYIPYTSNEISNYVTINSNSKPASPKSNITCSSLSAHPQNMQARLKIYYPGRHPLLLNTSVYTLPWWPNGGQRGYLTAICEVVDVKSGCDRHKVAYGEKQIPIIFPVVKMNLSHPTSLPLPRNKWVICHVGGFPAPSIKWYVLDSPRSNLIGNVVVDKEAFHISSIANGGEYIMVCAAQNDATLNQKYVLIKSFRFHVPRLSFLHLLQELSFTTQAAFGGILLIVFIFVTYSIFICYTYLRRSAST